MIRGRIMPTVILVGLATCGFPLSRMRAQHVHQSHPVPACKSRATV